MKRTNEVIANEAIQTGRISESDIRLLQTRLNGATNRARNEQDEAKKAAYKKERENVYNALNTMGRGTVRVSDEQARKGFAWLWNQYKTPRGVERKNNPFGYREINILEWVKKNAGTPEITLRDFYDAGNVYVTHYVPLYTLESPEGSFEYIVWGGGIQILG